MTVVVGVCAAATTCEMRSLHSAQRIRVESWKSKTHTGQPNNVSLLTQKISRPALVWCDLLSHSKRTANSSMIFLTSTSVHSVSLGNDAKKRHLPEN